jgi:hypothetical protein
MNDKLNEMWTALSAYQTRAVAAGHGESWALMCSERTERAAYAAAHVAWDADASYAAWAAEAAAYAATNVNITPTVPLLTLPKLKRKQNDLGIWHCSVHAVEHMVLPRANGQ